MLNALRKPEARYARRMARIARWDRPLTGRLDRLRAWASMLLVDHGLFRLLYLNRHRVTADLWRAAQPAPHQLRAFAAAGGRTVIYLRGGREHGSWPLEREACQRLGLVLAEFTLRSREAPERETLLALPAFLDSIAYPALVHCKSGADRAGFFVALYLLIRERRPAAEALRALSLRYGHLRWGKTGILDALIERYRDEGEAEGLDFIRWVETRYDPQALKAAFRPGLLSDFMVERVLRRE